MINPYQKIVKQKAEISRPGVGGQPFMVYLEKAFHREPPSDEALKGWISQYPLKPSDCFKTLRGSREEYDFLFPKELRKTHGEITDKNVLHAKLQSGEIPLSQYLSEINSYL